MVSGELPLSKIVPPNLVRARVCVKIRVRITVGDNFYGHHVNILGKIYLLIVGTLWLVGKTENTCTFIYDTFLYFSMKLII